MKAPKTRGIAAQPIRPSRWLAYATASAATMVTGAGSADGAIHYSGPLDVKVSSEKDYARFRLDRPGDSILLTHRTLRVGSFFAGFSGRAHPTFAYAAHGLSSSSTAVANLPFGASIAQQQFKGFGAFTRAVLVGPYGEFYSPGIAYIGFKFRCNPHYELQYGWVRVKMGGDARMDSFIVMDFAYGDPGELVTVGQTSDASPRSAMGSLGLLAAGAAGLVAWRKRRTKILPNE